MAKLKAPLLSLGAAQQLGKALVFFAWKGLDCVREYVVPANPRTAAQLTQRAYVTDAVAALHTAQGLAVDPVAPDDIIAYGLLASTHATPRTWFNEIVKRWLDQRVAALRSAIFRAGATVPGVGTLTVSIDFTEDGANAITAGFFWYGTSKTALVNSLVAVVAVDNATAVLLALTAGVKYYWQFRPTVHADFVGVRSGIYYGTPT